MPSFNLKLLSFSFFLLSFIRSVISRLSPNASPSPAPYSPISSPSLSRRPALAPYATSPGHAGAPTPAPSPSLPPAAVPTPSLSLGRAALPIPAPSPFPGIAAMPKPPPSPGPTSVPTPAPSPSPELAAVPTPAPSPALEPVAMPTPAPSPSPGPAAMPTPAPYPSPGPAAVPILAPSPAPEDAPMSPPSSFPSISMPPSVAPAPSEMDSPYKVNSPATLAPSTAVDPKVKGICDSTDNSSLCLATVVPILNKKNDVTSILKETIKAGAKLAQHGLSEAKKFSQEAGNSADRNDALETCTEDYETAVTSYLNAVGALSRKDKGQMNRMLSKVTIAIEDCEDVFSTSGGTSPFSSIASRLTNITSNCLTIISQLD